MQDLQGRLRYFTLQEVRFFPFHYPNAVALLLYGSLSHYRLYVVAWTGAAAFLVSRVAARFGSGDALALGGFTLAMAAAPIWNEGMYSYYAVPQRALFWAMAAWLCLFRWENFHRRGWAAAAALLSFAACGTYEIGYMFAALAFVVWCLRARSVKAGLFNTAPALGGMGVALIFHMLCGRSGGTGNEVSLDIPQVLRVLVQQMAASIPGLNSRILQEDCGVLSNGDRLWPLVLGVLAGLLLFFAVPREKLNRKMLGAAGFGLAVWALPALLLALSTRYQAPGAIAWKWGYIPAAASSIGFALVVAVLLAALAGACRKLPRIFVHSGAAGPDRRAGRRALPERLLPAGRRAHSPRPRIWITTSSLCAPSNPAWQMPSCPGISFSAMRMPGTATPTPRRPFSAGSPGATCTLPCWARPTMPPPGTPTPTRPTASTAGTTWPGAAGCKAPTVT